MPGLADRKINFGSLVKREAGVWSDLIKAIAGIALTVPFEPEPPGWR